MHGIANPDNLRGQICLIFGVPHPNIVSNILKAILITHTKNKFMAKTFLKELFYFCFLNYLAMGYSFMFAIISQ